MLFSINLRHAIYSLSTSLDMVGIDDKFHGKRVAYMASECAKALSMDELQRNNLIYASLLHDCGVSSTNTHKQLIAELDWEGSQAHCELGSRLLGSCHPLAHLAPVILYHHTHASELGKLDVDEQVALHANCIYMVDRVDALVAQHSNQMILNARDEIRDTIYRLRGKNFMPQLVDAFMDISANEAFWLELESEYVEEYLKVWLDNGSTKQLSFTTLRDIASLFSHIVDAKSPFTAEHSEGVARLARRLGEWFNLPTINCDKLELAGLLHDLGKLRVPDEILDKPGKLNTEEFAIIERHSFDSYHVLGNIEGLEDVAEWASQHHERVNGQGYPARLGGTQLSLEARILAVADVFQALAQKRPYRDSLPLAEILKIMYDMVASGHLDGDIVARVAESAEDSWEIAC